VHVRIGHDLFTPDAAERLTVEVDRVGGAYRVTGELRSKTGDVTLADTFTAEDCSTAIRSLAIIVAVRFTHLPEPCPVCPPPTTDQASPTLAKPISPPEQPKPTPAPVHLSPSREPPSIQAGIASVFAIGASPVVLGGVGWFIGVRWPRFSAALEGQALFAPSVEIRATSVHDDYHFFLASASASACVHGAWLFVCLQAGWGSLSFEHTTQVIDPNYLSRSSFGFRFGAERALTRTLAVRAYADASFDPISNNLKHLTDPSYIIWHKSNLSGSVGIGPVITF
jgi:hypothetical protein